MADDSFDIGEEDTQFSKKKKMIIMIALLVALLGGGAVAYFLFFSGGEPSEEVVEDKPSIYLSLDPAFTTDYLVDGRQRYVQLKMTVKSKNAEHIEAVTLHMPLIRNSLILLLSSQSFIDLQTEEGKIAFKAASVEAINGILEQEMEQEGQIDGVLFTSFVMQ